MSEGERVAKCGLGREAEEIADPSGVTTAGVDLLEDAVFSERLRSERVLFQGNWRPTGTRCGAVLRLTDWCVLMLPGHPQLEIAALARLAAGRSRGFSAVHKVPQHSGDTRGDTGDTRLHVATHAI